MHRLALLSACLASLTLFAADAPKTETPSAKPAEKPAVPVKKKKGLEAPEIPAGISLSDGVKLQEAWIKAEHDEDFKSAVAKLGGTGEKEKKGEKKKPGGKEGREAVDAVRVKAMQKADPSLNVEVIRAYVASTHQKKSDVAGKPKKK
jgi:hypothetical protein